MDKKKNILILVPSINARGGISNYFHTLKKEFSSNIQYFERGARTWPSRKGTFNELYRAWKDYLNYKKRINKNNISLVHSNTSLGLNSIIRDGVFLKYANNKNISTVVFFHGWSESNEKKISKYYLKLFKYLFFQCDKFIVLSSHVKSTLVKWGYKGEIIEETTLYDKRLTKNVCKHSILAKYYDINKLREFNILFLSRMEVEKGIYDLLEAYKELLTELSLNIKLNLTYCGDGKELDSFINACNALEFEGVSIEGFVEGNEKQLAFVNSHLFVLPSYTEGMPLAVLEAMGFGLPVLVTPVGGLKDIIKSGQNGYFIKIKSPEDIKSKILSLIHNPTLLNDIALNNYEFANDKFRSDVVSKRLEKIYENILNN